MTALPTFTPPPSIIVRSGSGGNLHAYWALREPIPATWARRANRRLVLTLGADRVATDAARLLRPVGSFNHKRSPPVPVVCVRLETDVFTITEVVGGGPDSREYVAAEPPTRSLCRVGPGTLEGLARTVREARPGSRNNILYWAGRRAREHIDSAQLDEHAVRDVLRDSALVAGLGEDGIAATLRSALDARAMA